MLELARDGTGKKGKWYKKEEMDRWGRGRFMARCEETAPTLTRLVNHLAIDPQVKKGEDLHDSAAQPT